MEFSEFQNQYTKTANINFRVAPSHKARLIEQGARLGLNLSDYVGRALEKAEKDAEEAARLSGELARTKAELDRFYKALEPLASKSIGKEVRAHGKNVVVNDPVHLLQILLQTFKYQEQ